MPRDRHYVLASGEFVPQKYPDGAGHSQVDRTLGAYHRPQGDQAQRYAAITEGSQHFARMLADLCPPSAELTLAIRAVEEARMRANQAIAVNETAPAWDAGGGVVAQEKGPRLRLVLARNRAEFEHHVRELPPGEAEKCKFASDGFMLRGLQHDGTLGFTFLPGWRENEHYNVEQIEADFAVRGIPVDG